MMTPINRNAAVVLCFSAALAVAGCGGGGGGGPSNLADRNNPRPMLADPPPVRTGGQSAAATATPVAGSVTQSSHVRDGVTADSVSASVSLDARGLLTADIGSGTGDWRLRNLPAWFRQHGSKWNTITFPQMQTDGSRRLGVIFTDRTRPPEMTVTGSQTWVSSGNLDPDDIANLLDDGVSGTLDGVEGTLFCSDSNACDYSYAGPSLGTPSFDDIVAQIIQNQESPGKLKFISKSNAQNPPADTDHLVLGYWDYIPKKWLKPSEEYPLRWEDQGFGPSYYNEIEYGVFVNGSDPFAQANIQGLTGTATYSGDAFALYIDKNLYAVQRPAYLSAEDYYPTHMGKDTVLTAAVTLTANFGNGGEYGTVSGAVSNFETDDPCTPACPTDLTVLPTTLALQSASIGDGHSGFFTGSTSMTFDGSSFTGKWGGQFYGNGEADGNPGSAAGTFGAATDDETKAIIGMFGAYKQ